VLCHVIENEGHTSERPSEGVAPKAPRRVRLEDQRSEGRPNQARWVRRLASTAGTQALTHQLSQDHPVHGEDLMRSLPHQAARAPTACAERLAGAVARRALWAGSCSPPPCRRRCWRSPLAARMPTNRIERSAP
jgi:hypothetical protein